MKTKVYLVDGSGYIFRAFYAITSLTTKSGFPTNALYGFTRMLKKLLDDVHPGHIAVAFDVGRNTFRAEMYPEYKANRAACPEDLLKQMPYFREIVAAMGLHVLELPGFEADDIIGTLAKRLERDGHEVEIISGDKDLTQLVNTKISVYDPMHDKRFREAEVIEKFGVKASQIVELLALMGDSSDNVPGVDGVGPKTAAQLIEKYENIENVVASLGAIKEDSSIRNRKKIVEQIESNLDLLRLSRRLVEIKTDSPVLLNRGENQVLIDSLDDVELCEALKLGEPNRQSLSDIMTRFEFSSLLQDWFADAQGALNLGMRRSVAQIEPPGGALYKTVWASDFPAWLDLFSKQKEFAFDLETTSLKELEAKIVGLSFCWNDKEAFYVPVGHQDGKGQVDLKDFLRSTQEIFKNSAIKKCGQNLKYDIKVLGAHGVEVDGVDFDSMVAAYLLSPDKGSYNLTVLAHDYLGYDTIEFEEVVKDAADFSGSDIADATRYSCQDAHYVWLLKSKLCQRLKDEGLWEVASEIDMPLVPVLARMELKGVKLDTALLASMSDEFAQEMQIQERAIFEAAGCEFNINSPKQLAEVLFEKLQLPTKGLKRTKTGISTDSSVLEKLAEIHDLPAKILDYRSLAKLKSTYIDALPAQISPVTGRLHTRFNQTATATGRLSSSDPNLQNIPIQSKEGAKIRSAFVADSGKVVISSDYSQIELRLLAHMSNDKNMISAFKSDIDIHAGTAREVFGLKSTDDVSTEQRRFGKTINFGIVYGMGAFRLSRELGIPLNAANSYIERYFSHFSGVKAFFDTLEKDAVEKGIVRTMFGRKRVLADIDSSGRDKGFVVRAAMNAPIQGSAADVIKKAMVRIDKRIRQEKLPLEMLLQIHDELVFECDKGFAEEALSIVHEEMEGVANLSVPLKAEAGVGRNWQEAHR